MLIGERRELNIETLEPHSSALEMREQVLQEAFCSVKATIAFAYSGALCAL